MKVLAIGNSFSQDATRYLHDVAKADGYDLKVVNLFIGGCPLSLHYKNINNDNRAYLYEFNGINTEICVSVKDALESDLWDYVTVQQVSRESMDYETYQPYLDALVSYIHKYCPKAKILVHETWAYKDKTDTLQRFGYENQADMYNDVKNAYIKAAEHLKTEMIPSGEAMQNLLRNGVPVIHRDHIHASFGLGRLTLAFTWYEFLTGRSTDGIEIPDSVLDEPVSEKEILLAKISAHDAVEKKLIRN